MSGILFALIAAVCWGSIVLVSTKLGGDVYSQTLGTTVGALLFASVVFFITKPETSLLAFGVGIVSGVFWSVGQKNQFSALQYLGISKTPSISASLQLIGTSLFGIFIFKEWTSLSQITLGCMALFFIMMGAVLTSMSSRGERSKTNNFRKGFLILLLSSAGYVGYIIIIRWFHIDAWSALLPQSIGMVLGGLFITFQHHPFTKYTFRNILTGFVWATGNLMLLLSLPLIGVATSFSLSQTGVVISTLGGLFLFHEKQSRKQTAFILTGSLLVIIGGMLIGWTKR